MKYIKSSSFVYIIIFVLVALGATVYIRNEMRSENFEELPPEGIHESAKIITDEKKEIDWEAIRIEHEEEEARKKALREEARVEKLYLSEELPINEALALPVSSDDTVTLNIKLSSLSAPKARIDAMWQLGQVSSDVQYLGPFAAIAEPMQLIESVEVVNNSSEEYTLHGIYNENIEGLEFFTRRRQAPAPIMLLPESVKVNSENIACEGRSVYRSLGGGDSGNPMSLSVNNRCVFKGGITILPNTSTRVAPTPYMPSWGKTGTRIIDPFNGGSEYVIEVKLRGDTEHSWLVPRDFEGYDETLGDNTLHIGGYIFAKDMDPELLRDIFDIRNSSNEQVNVEIGTVETGARIMSYEIPTEPFAAPATSEIEDKVLGMQAFFVVNDFWGPENVTGVYDESTQEMVKAFQKEVNLAETGLFDEGTMRAVKAFKTFTRFWENYGDGQVTLGFLGSNDYFSRYSVGEAAVRLNENNETGPLVKGWAPGQIEYIDSGASKIPDQPYVDILNNTEKTQFCVVYDTDGKSVEEFSIAQNELFETSDVLGKSNQDRLQCGSRILRLYIGE